MTMLLDFETITKACLMFPGYNEFICLLNLNDFLSVKNWIIDLKNGGEEAKFKMMNKDDSIKEGFISVNLDGFTIHFKHIQTTESFIGPIIKL